MKKIHILPDNDKTNGWSKLISFREPKTSLDKDVKADWLIIGGGFAGLAAARRIAENRPGDKIILIEADVVGEGAQGRNSGFAIDIPHNVGSSMDELRSAHSYLRLTRASIASLRELKQRYSIECDWSESGKFHTAVSPKGIKEVLLPTKKMLDSLGEENHWLEGGKLHEKLGFTHFQAGIYTPGTVLLNPAALTKGLADNLPSNVTLYEKTPALAVDYSDDVKVMTPTGNITAKKLILTVNVFMEQFGFYKNKLIPMAAHASLTRAMSEAEQERLVGLSSWGLTPANAFVGITMRRTPDQRILIRQNMKYAPNLRTTDSERQKAREIHQKLFEERFPMLKGVTMEHTWTGYICISRNGAPGFGQLSPNVYSAVCQNGVGITKGTFSGMLIADMATGVESPLLEDMKTLGKPSALPSRPFLDFGVKSRFQWELWSSRAEA